MTITLVIPLTSHWQHVHADWWQDDQGNDIHRAEIDGVTLYHCHFAGSPLPWDAVATSLDEAMAIASRARARPAHDALIPDLAR
ncbi:hypothetical protein QLQ85_07925 [Halomonas sp. M4R5S39]|uniref:hypothetical protein n=1 Tax=Halomonas kalidii TaxID=3043293 RepID=UPI0024A850D5|nr:hypothetical protein [Halomonas kalidii]MDI5984716.1 hypothetical protein [Halomonas kalidii]